MGLFNKNRKPTKPAVDSDPPLPEARVDAEPYHGSEANLEQLAEARDSKDQNEALERPGKQSLFLMCMRKEGNVSRACAAAGISRGTAYRWKANDEGSKDGEGDGFSSRWEEVVSAYVDELETEVDRRAFTGIDVPVIYQGEAMHSSDGKPLTLKKYSDSLAALRLKALRPDKYRERTETAHTGDMTHTTRVVFVMPDNGRD